MGDIATHAAIAEQVIGILRERFPDERYGFVELGNWLTDMSQFRDPYAMISAKMTIWRRSRAQAQAAGRAGWAWQLNVANIDDYANAMMGAPGANGVLVRFFRDLVYAMGCERFRHRDVAPNHFAEIFRNHFTQYFPHEHLDFPPWPHGHVIGDRDPSPWLRHVCDEPPQKAAGATPASGAAKRKHFEYLDDQIEYVAELLTWVEHHWRRIRLEPDSPDNTRMRHELLARFGHACHAIEDYYFHSNFVEIGWFRIGRNLPPVRGMDHHRARRRYWRRLRLPAQDGRSLSQRESYAAGTLYTGSFGSTDVFHTFIDAAETFADEGSSLPGPFRLAFADLASEERRRRLIDDRARLDFVRRWCAWADGPAEREIDDSIARRQLHRDSGEALKRAIRLDRDTRRRFSTEDFEHIPEDVRGPFGFFVQLIAMAQEEHDTSERRSAELDRGRREEDQATDIGASAENIGCHSLLAKDSPHKEPLRQPAVNLATWVACCIARVMSERVAGELICGPRLPGGSDGGCTVDRAMYVDWLHLLQHFLCHPDQAEERWHLPPLELDSPGDARNPNILTQSHCVVRMLPSDQARRRMATDGRGRLSAQARLEQRYTALEPLAQRDWDQRE